jgi:hypothetical protein
MGGPSRALVARRAHVTVKFVELETAPPPVVTLILPVVAPAGTVAVICVSESTVNELAAMLLNATAVAPVNATPLMVTTVPTGPDGGENPLIDGGTLKFVGLDPLPPGVVTLILPLAPQQGTTAVICEYESTVNELAGMLLNVTAVAPVKAAPVIVTTVPTGPLAGVKLVIFGWTLKFPELWTVPPGATTVILPVSAPPGTVAVIWVSESTTNDADVPSNCTSVDPVNADPVIVTTAPTAPEVGEKPERVGVGPPT